MFQIIFSISAASIAVIYPLYALVKKERTLASWALFGALFFAAALELFDLLAVIQPGNLFFWKKLAMHAESCLPFCWFLFSLTFARANETRLMFSLQSLLLALSLVFFVSHFFFPAVAFFYSPDFGQERMLFLENWGYFFYLVLLVYMIAAMINLELTFTSASRGVRWNIKFEILGAGSLLAALVFYYSQGLLYRTINMNLIPFRTAALFITVIFTAYSQLWRMKTAKIRISRRVVYKSVVLLAVGLYLMALGLAGEGMKYLGESFQRSIAITLAFAAGLGFLIVLLSETMKRKIKVFLDRNFYQDKYDYRGQWLQFTDRLSSAKTGDELLQSILSGYCETFGMGCGALFLRNDNMDCYYLAAKVQIDSSHAAFNSREPFIDYMRNKGWVVNLHELKPSCERDEFLEKNEVSFAVPLFLEDRLSGFILLGRPLARNETYGTEDYDLMKALARQTSSALLNLHLADQLAQAKEMEVLGKVSAFVAHDLKNLVYSISLMLDNAREYIADPEFQQDMLLSLDNTVAKMKTLIAKLKYFLEKKGLIKESADLLRLVSDTAETVTGVEVNVNGTSVVAQIDKDEMQKVILNLLLNAVDATDGKGPITVLTGSNERAYIRIADKGCGIPEDFMSRRLFTPFNSTKKSGLGIGLYQCKQIVEAHGGSIEVESKVGAGSVFTVWLPLTI